MPVKVALDADGQPTQALREEARGARPRAPGHRVARRGRRPRSHLRRSPTARPSTCTCAALAKGQPLARGAAGRARRRAREAADPEGDELRRRRRLLQRREVRPPGAPALALHGADVVPVHGARPRRRTHDRRPSLPGRARHRDRDRRRLRADARGRGQGASRRSPQRRAAIVAAARRRRRRARRSIMPDALLDEVTALVEWPAVYAGTFDPAFLAVPQECLILTMQQNQKYFALADDGGRLAAPLPAGQQPRDRRTRGDRRTATSACCARGSPTRSSSSTRTARRALDARVPKLAQRRLSQQARHAGASASSGCASLAREHRAADRRRRARSPIARRGSPRPISSPTWSASFPSCRALMGRYYAQHDGEPPAVADAIEQHYWPRFAGDALPRRRSRRRSRSPTSSRRSPACSASARSPPATRIRSACAAQRSACCASWSRSGCALPLPELVDARVRRVRRRAGGQAGAAPTLASFVYERLRGYLREQGYTANQVEAVLVPAARRASTSCPRGSRRSGVRGAARGRRARRRQQAHRQHPEEERRARRRPPSTARGSPTAPSTTSTSRSRSSRPGRRRLRARRLHRRAAGAGDGQAGRRPLLRRRDGDGRRPGGPRQPARAAARRRGDDEPRRRHLEARRLTRVTTRHGPARLRSRHRPTRAAASSSSSTATASSTTTATSSSSRRTSGGRSRAASRRSRGSTTPATASSSRPTSRASAAACSTWRR